MYTGVTFLAAAINILASSSGGFSKLVSALVSVGLYAGVATCGYVHIKRKTFEPVGIAVIFAAALAAFFILISIASTTVNGGLVKATGIIGGIAVLGAYSALILLMRAQPLWFKITQYSAIGVAWLAGIVAAAFVLKATSSSGFEDSSLSGLVSWSKAIGILALLTIAVAIVTILLWRLALRYPVQAAG